MDMTGEVIISAPRIKVWAALNDPEFLKASIPGCESMSRDGDTSFIAKVVAKIGPVKASFTGKVTLADINPPQGYILNGEGQGGAAGFAKGSAKVQLTEQDPDTTILAYTVSAQVGGKLAQIGSRLVDSAAKKMADDFFARFAAGLIEQKKTDPASTSSVQKPTLAATELVLPGKAEGDKKLGFLPPKIWIPALIVVSLIILISTQL